MENEITKWFDAHHILNGIDNVSEERIVESIALGLITLFKNNPHLIKYLTNEKENLV